MIKITQEFETESEAKRALNSKNYFSALWEIEQHLHNTIKNDRGEIRWLHIMVGIWTGSLLA